MSWRALAGCASRCAAIVAVGSSACTSGSTGTQDAGSNVCVAAPVDLRVVVPTCDAGGSCPNLPITASEVRAIHGLAPNDVWFLMWNSVIHWDGTTTSVAYVDPAVAGSVVGLLEVAPDDVWIVPSTDPKRPVLVRLRAGHAEEVSIPLTNVTGVAADGPNDVWFAGEPGAAHWDGSTMTFAPRAPPGATGGGIQAIGVAAGDVWATDRYGYTCIDAQKGCGQSEGGILHWNGATWDTVAPVSVLAASTILVLAPGDVWTSDGKMNGPPWPVEWRPRAISGTSDVDVWGIGASPGLVHWDGEAVKPVPSPTNAGLTSLYVAPSGWGAVGDTHGSVLVCTRMADLAATPP